MRLDAAQGDVDIRRILCEIKGEEGDLWKEVANTDIRRFVT